MVKIKPKLRISTAIFWMSIITGMVVICGFVFSSMNIFNSIFDKLYQEKALAITNSINAAMRIGDLNDDEKLLNTIQKYIYINPDIYQLNINAVNENNELMVKASNVSSLMGLKSGEENNKSFLDEAVVQEKVTLDNGDSGIKVIAPIIFGGRKMGTYELILTTQLASTEFRKKMTTFLGAIFIFVLLASLLFFEAVRRKIIMPIDKVVYGVDQIGSGNLNYKIKVESDDEIGRLAMAFNENTKKLSDSYHGLEIKIEERTKDLKDSLEKIEEQNKNLKNSSQAMINILEDDRELQEALKREKEGVEKKIIERTQELSNTKAKLDSSIENLPLGFMMIDIQEKVVISNHLALEFLGKKDKKKAYGEIKKILKEKIDLKKYIKNCGQEKEVLVFPDIVIKSRYFQFLISPILTREKEKLCIGIVALIQDITEAKIVERSKDEFFSIASHELRTPLTAIRGNTSMILEYYSKEIKDPELKAMVDDVHESSIRLINIVNDFLNVSRLEQSKMVYDIKEFNIEELILEIIGEYDVTSSQRKIGIDYIKASNPLPLVMGDREKVRQIIINLLGNALKFTFEGGIKISTERNDNFVKVLISDTGKGISLKQQSLLFHKFQQTGESLFTRDTSGGSGLGLYIAKMMIEGMNGEIKLEKSEENIGSIFSFTLPVVKANK